MNSEKETDPSETLKSEEGFPSTLLLLRLYRFGAVLALLLGIGTDPRSPAGQGCIFIAFFCALVGFWIFALSNLDFEEPAE